MNDMIEEIKYRGLTIRIAQDDCPENPREWCDHVTTMLCMHTKYKLGDEHDLGASSFSGWDDVRDYIEEEYDPAVIAPLYMYDHSGLTIRMGHGFEDIDSGHWDWGQIGFIFIPREVAYREFKWQRITKDRREKLWQIMQSDVDEYNLYLHGEIYAFNIVGHCDKCGTAEYIDSCCGIFDYDYAIELAKQSIDAMFPEAAQDTGT